MNTDTLLELNENIEYDNIFKINKFKDKPPHPSYLAGLIDGDGCIYIRQITDGYQSGISITQSRTNILRIIKYHYGGTIYSPTEYYTNDIINEYGFIDKLNKRNSYTLVIRSNEYKYLLNDIKDHILLKTVQINALYEFSKLVNKENTERKNELFEICSNANLEKTYNDNNDIDIKLNDNYIRGLFDAEGHIFLSYKKMDDNQIRFTKGVYIKITQKNYPFILEKIQNYLGFGKISDSVYYVDTFELCNRLIDILNKDLIIKDIQINTFKKYLDTKLSENNTYTDELHEIRLNLYKIINTEKHKIEVYYPNNNINENEGYNKRILDDEIIENNNKKLHMIEINKIKSEKMKGENNLNYGKPLDNNHALNISIQTSIAKRRNNGNLSDEKIKEIYELKGTDLQINIAEKYKMNRETIRRIWNKSIVPIDSEEFILNKEAKIKDRLSLLNEDSQPNNIELTHQLKTSLGKRTLTTDEMIEIMLWKIKAKNNEKLNSKKISSTKLSEHLSELWNKKVSNDIIKNLWSGKTKIFDFEFIDKEITYEKYLEIIELK